MKCKYFILIILLHFKALSFSQAVDSAANVPELKLQLEKTNVDSVKVRMLNKLANHYYEKDNDLALEYINKAIDLAKKNKLTDLLGNCYYTIGTIYGSMGNRKTSIEYILEGIKIYTGTKNEIKISDGYLKIGAQYFGLGAYDKSIEYYKKVLPIYQKISDKKGEALIYNNIGSCYLNLGDNENARLYYKSSLKLEEVLGNKDGMAETWINIGTIYYMEKRYEEALAEFEKALPVLTDGNESIKAVCLINIAVSLTDLKRYKEAETNFISAIASIKKIGSFEYLGPAYYNYALCLKGLKKFKEANEYLNLKIAIDDSLSNRYLLDQITEMSEKYEDEKKKQEIALLTKENKSKEQDNKIKELNNANQRAELSKSSVVIYFTLAALLVLVVVTVVLINGNRAKNKANIQLNEQKKEILSAKEIIERKNKDILDSIRYAKKIQDAILHEENKALAELPEHFIIFKPKDIVSGDFYWTVQKNNGWYAAVADCTGHGVPGAFMSMLGIAFLNEITNHEQMLSPEIILDELRTKLIKELGQSGEVGENKDGMDITLIRYDSIKKKLEFSGAHNSLIILRDGEIIQLNADTQPVGYQILQHPFTKTEFIPQNGDTLYLMSDGYADQFGGEKKKKFKMSRLKESLKEISKMKLSEQERMLTHQFESWKGDMEQIDDVCILGIKL